MAGWDISDLDRRVVEVSIDVVSRVTIDDLDRPTPCAEWSLADLLTHMTVQHVGFAAAADGRGADPAVWKMATLGEGAVAAYAEASGRLIEAFADPGVLDRDFELPEIGAPGPFPGSQAISFHFIDYVVHGWDVARSIGLGFGVDEDLVEAALRVARLVPQGEARLRPGAAFAPNLPVPDGASDFDEVLLLLGRSPSWPNTSAGA